MVFQRALRARNALCLGLIEAAEVERGARYEYVVRIRPDFAFTDCSNACVVDIVRARSARRVGISGEERAGFSLRERDRVPCDF